MKKQPVQRDTLMTYIKLLTVLTTLALLTACGGGGGTAETKTDDKGEGTSVCTTNAFHADCGTEFETQRQTIISECIDDESGELCTDATTFACTDNFFHELCNDIKEYEDKRTEFNNTCTNTKSQTVCDMEALVRNCAANPFMNTCLMDTGAIALRESRCLANIQIDDSCRGTTGIATLFCEANPFDTATPCMHGDYADDRQTACLANIAIDDSCRGDRGIATLFCKDDPFNTATACMHNDYADERLDICRGESTSTRCTPLVTPICELDFNNALCRGRTKYDEQLRCADGACVVNTADWLASPAVTVLGTAPASTHTANGFLSGLTDTQPEVEGFTLGATQPFGSSLTLAYNGLGGDATDGASFFFGNFGLTRRYYAGIHASTDLGAPLDNISQAGVWTGWILLDGVIPLDETFDLTVTFNTASQGGTIAALIPSANLLYDIDGMFDENGVIEGTVIFGVDRNNDEVIDTMRPVSGGAEGAMEIDPERTPGILTGLIGQEGVVAAFFSTTSTNNNDDMLGSNPYTGAFVAISQKEAERVEQAKIKYTDWIGGFGVSPPPDTPSSPATNQFLAGTTTLDPLTDAVVPLTLTSTIGGVGFFKENGAYYAGLLSNTNVGLPVADTPQVDSADVMATWPGKIRAIQVFDGNANAGDTQTALELNLTVNLTARTFTATRFDPNASTTSITINGLFPATDNGVVTGTVRQSAGNFHRDGQLTGIIGQDGVVGAFYSDSDVAVANRYVGGFYAAPTQ